VGVNAMVPGLRREDVRPAPPIRRRTGVPAFLGIVGAAPPGEPTWLNAAADVGRHLGAAPAGGHLVAAVEGFFAGGGALCLLVPLDPRLRREAALATGLDRVAEVDGTDLVVAPDLTRRREGGLPPDPEEVVELQRAVLERCTLQRRFALLDALPGVGTAGVIDQRVRLASTHGALYHPWLVLPGRDAPVPPTGHVAGVYAAGDAQVGVHKPPANAVLHGVVGVAERLSAGDLDALASSGVNVIRPFPGRGVRVWGARTLADPDDRDWQHVNVRRLVLAVIVDLEALLERFVFEPHERGLQGRLARELAAYCDDLHRRGALRGAVSAAAYRVRCDEALNPPEVRAAGTVVAEVTLAPRLPNERITLRVVQAPAGPAAFVPD
jgi:uncharacterized protein